MPQGSRRPVGDRSEEHTSELQSLTNAVCRLLLEKKRHRPASGRRIPNSWRALSRRRTHRWAGEPISHDHWRSRSGSSLSMNVRSVLFFFNDTATTEIYTLSLHDALPI